MSEWLLTVADVIQLHDDAIEQSGGASGILSLDLLEAKYHSPPPRQPSEPVQKVFCPPRGDKTCGLAGHVVQRRRHSSQPLSPLKKSAPCCSRRL